MLPAIEEARDLAERGHLDKAWVICDRLLQDDIEDGRALSLAAFILEKQGRSAVAYHIAHRLIQIYPTEAAAWTILGRNADILWEMDEAKSAYRQSIAIAKNDFTRCTNYLNLAATHLQLGEWKEAREFAEKALKLEPDNRKAQHNLGLCQLAAREWKEGWKNYRGSLGSGNRICFNYVGEPEWNGEPDKTVVIFGEQGLGDEICAASMFNDAIGISKKVVIDCDKRLESLFKRSFPKASVYGTRTSKELDWVADDQEIDASIAAMQLGGLFRNNDADFFGTPYLRADGDEVAKWKGLWATKKKPVIGVAWTGGVASTAAHARRWALNDLLPIFKSIDAHWVCLQYKDATQEIADFLEEHPEIDLRQYKQTLHKDYDETASLVASLDCVVSMQTSVVHLAGALGIPTLCGVSHCSQWRYGTGDDLPWYQSVKIYRQEKNLAWPFRRIAKDLQETINADLYRLRSA